MNPNDWHRATANIARHRLNLIKTAHADLPATPALERLFHIIAWDMSNADLETFCSIPGASTAGRIELPL